MRLLEHPMREIGTVQVWISALGEPTFGRIFDPLLATGVSIALALVLTTYVLRGAR